MTNDQIIEKLLQMGATKEFLHEMPKLTTLETEIISLRYGLAEENRPANMSQFRNKQAVRGIVELSKRFNMSRDKVKRYEGFAFHKLHKYFKASPQMPANAP